MEAKRMDKPTNRTSTVSYGKFTSKRSLKKSYSGMIEGESAPPQEQTCNFKRNKRKFWLKVFMRAYRRRMKKKKKKNLGHQPAPSWTGSDEFITDLNAIYTGTGDTDSVAGVLAGCCNGAGCCSEDFKKEVIAAGLGEAFRDLDFFSPKHSESYDETAHADPFEEKSVGDDSMKVKSQSVDAIDRGAFQESHSESEMNPETVNDGNFFESSSAESNVSNDNKIDRECEQLGIVNEESYANSTSQLWNDELLTIETNEHSVSANVSHDDTADNSEGEAIAKYSLNSANDELHTPEHDVQTLEDDEQSAEDDEQSAEDDLRTLDQGVNHLEEQRDTFEEKPCNVQQCISSLDGQSRNLTEHANKMQSMKNTLTIVTNEQHDVISTEHTVVRTKASINSNAKEIKKKHDIYSPSVAARIEISLSPVAPVETLKGWLNDFGRKNKEHFEKNQVKLQPVTYTSDSQFAQTPNQSNRFYDDAKENEIGYRHRTPQLDGGTPSKADRRKSMNKKIVHEADRILSPRRNTSSERNLLPVKGDMRSSPRKLSSKRVDKFSNNKTRLSSGDRSI